MVAAADGNIKIFQDYFDVNDTAIVPFVVEPELPTPDRIIDLNVFFSTMDDGTNR